MDENGPDGRFSPWEVLQDRRTFAVIDLATAQLVDAAIDYAKACYATPQDTKAEGLQLDTLGAQACRFFCAIQRLDTHHE